MSQKPNPSPFRANLNRPICDNIGGVHRGAFCSAPRPRKQGLATRRAQPELDPGPRCRCSTARPVTVPPTTTLTTSILTTSPVTMRSGTGGRCLCLGGFSLRDIGRGTDPGHPEGTARRKRAGARGTRPVRFSRTSRRRRSSVHPRPTLPVPPSSGCDIACERRNWAGAASM